MSEYFYELWGEECDICNNDNNDFYFINECRCIYRICQDCTYKMYKCPFCRQFFSIQFLNTPKFYKYREDIVKTLIQTLRSGNYWNMSNSQFDQIVRDTYTIWGWR